MFWIDIVFIIILALLLSGLIVWAFGWRHPARSEAVGLSILFLFLILMFTMWAGSAWIPPWGPIFFGTAWFHLLVIGIIISLLILAVSAPPRQRATTVVEKGEEEPPSEAATVFGIFFWVLIAALLVTALVSYFM